VVRRILPAVCVALVCAAGAPAGLDASQATTTGAQAKSRKPAKRAPAPDVAYVGCLRSEDGGKTFVLTEVGGPDIQEARSWRTFFIRKRADKLRVVPIGKLNLAKHEGRTVKVVGHREKKEFRVHGIKVVGETCG
jgi:hypothetical protein